MRTEKARSQSNRGLIRKATYYASDIVLAKLLNNCNLRSRILHELSRLRLNFCCATWAPEWKPHQSLKVRWATKLEKESKLPIMKSGSFYGSTCGGHPWKLHTEWLGYESLACRKQPCPRHVAPDPPQPSCEHMAKCKFGSKSVQKACSKKPLAGLGSSRSHP